MSISSSTTTLLLIVTLFFVVAATIVTSMRTNKEELDNIVEILEYGNQFCTGPTFVNTSTKTNVCYSGKYASGSGILSCITSRQNNTDNQRQHQHQEVFGHRCVRLHYFSDSKCTQATQIDDHVCDTCPGDKQGQHSEVKCPSKEEIFLSTGCSFDSNEKRCSNCTSNVRVNVGVCTETRNKDNGNYVYVDTVTECKQGVIEVKDFSGTTDCSPTAPMSDYLVPNEGCQGGVRFVCKK